MKLLWITLVLCALVASSVLGKDKSGDLAILTAKFHSITTELGENGLSASAYEAETAALLRKLEQFQYPGAVRHNISLEWFSGTYVQAAPLRVVIVVSSFEGMYLNSGIGTFYSALADFLVNHGHTVTILYTRTDGTDATTSKTFMRWQTSYAKKGISIMRLDPLPIHITSTNLTQKSYQVYQYLKAHQQEFDVVHFPDWEGPGYFSVVAKHQGLAFANKKFIVGLHGPWRWVKHGNQNLGLTEPEDFETDWLERRSVELADFVVTPSADLPRWLTSEGWTVSGGDVDGRPNKLSLMPFLPGREVLMANQRQTISYPQKVKVLELVFFGRLETRKGVVLFADSLDLLAARRPELETIKITFLGRSVDIDGRASTKYLNNRAVAGKWPYKITFSTHKDRKAALDYLVDEGRGRVAVIPSLVDNAPYTVYECLYSKIPFIASDLPSIAALITPDDKDTALFAAEASALASRMEHIIDNGVAPVRGLVSTESAIKSWEAFYNMIGVQQETTHAPIVAAEPLVSVCITHFNRPELLAMALQSVKAQDYPSAKIEIVLVDDGSTDKNAIEYIDGLREQFSRNNWQIIKTENNYLGAARNTAARMARGDYLVFLDDDNIAKPNQLSTYIAVAQATGADLLTAAHDVFRGRGLPTGAPNTNIASRSVPLGPAIALGVFKNCFGDANFFIKSRVFAQTGGFTEEKGVGQEDYEFLADAVLSGLYLEAIPEPLLYYRMHNKSDQMVFSTDPVANQVRSARPFQSVMDDDSTEASETLTLMARRHSMRSAQNIALVCNMTVTRVQPATIKALTRTLINFTAHTMDCQITDIKIGSYVCTNISQNAGSGEFQCLSPALPFPGSYSVYVKYAESSAPERLGQALAVQTDGSVKTVAAAMLKYIADNSLYTLQKLFDLMADLGSFAVTNIGVIDDLILQPGQFKRAVHASAYERHDLRFALTSDDDETATDLAVRLIQLALANRDRFLAIGVTILDFNIIGKCDENMNCDCTPSYTGEGCGDSASCLNNCTGHGQCVDGPYSRVCECTPGYTGRDCSLATCPDDCSGHGACRLSTGDAQPLCICDKGWDGLSCSTTKECPGNCYGKGTCSSGVCMCESGWTGDDCRKADNLGKDDNSSEDLGVTIGMSIAAGVAGLALIAAIGLFAYLRKLKQ